MGNGGKRFFGEPRVFPAHRVLPPGPGTAWLRATAPAVSDRLDSTATVRAPLACPASGYDICFQSPEKVLSRKKDKRKEVLELKKEEKEMKRKGKTRSLQNGTILTGDIQNATRRKHREGTDMEELRCRLQKRRRWRFLAA